ncbi:MAG: hypothetical protein KDN20_04465 [Verrucomicrobiae bacterium]|nr:hypothetical protein [Verrucomicrobiae bacterium]
MNSESLLRPLRVGGLSLLVAMAGTISALAETVTVDGQIYENAEMADVGESGLYYNTADGGFVVVPWSQLNQFQLTAVKARFKEQVENVRLRAIWVEGTVFENHKDGIVVQVSLDLGGGDESEKPEKPTYKNGGELAKGLVMIKDLKDNAIKKPGDPVEGIFYKEGTYTYEVAGFNLIKEIALCSQAKPKWASEREWTNREGNKLKAKVIAVRDGKCLFQQGDRNFPYEIAQLSDEDQELVAQFERRALEIPVF